MHISHLFEWTNDYSHVRLFVLETDVQGQNERVLDALRHVWVPCAVIQDKTTDKLRLRCCSMLHLHDLNHM